MLQGNRVLLPGRGACEDEAKEKIGALCRSRNHCSSRHRNCSVVEPGENASQPAWWWFWRVRVVVKVVALRASGGWRGRFFWVGVVGLAVFFKVPRAMRGLAKDKIQDSDTFPFLWVPRNISIEPAEAHGIK